MKKHLHFGLLAALILQINCLKDLNIIISYFEEKSIKHATVFGCFNKNEHIIVAKILMSQTRPISVSTMDIQNIHRKLKTEHIHVEAILDGDCPNSETFLIKCGEFNFFDVKHHWLILASSLNVSEKFREVNLNINADVQIAVTNTTSATTIFDLYNPASKQGGVLNYTYIGFYNKEIGYKIRKDEPKYWARKNMTGVTFKSMVVLPVAFNGTLENYLNSDDDRDINTFNRFHSRLCSFCQSYYNYSLNIKTVDSWGYTNPDSTFDGMVGALERKVIDFGSSSLFLREDRARVIDYGRNTWILRAAFLFRNPKTHTSIEVFLYPLPTSVWLITALLAIVAIVILKIVTTFEKRKYHRSSETTWSVSLILTLGAFCQQGSPSTPRMACGRITTISIFLLSIIIYQFYSASLVSHLLMTPVTNIKNIKELLKSPLRAGCEDILYDKDYFQHTTDEVAIQLYNKKILGKRNTSNYFPPETGLKMVEQGGFAFHVETATAYPIIRETFAEKAICELREIQLFKTQPMHANYQKRSPFREMFDVCFQRLAESGILFRERKHWHPRRPQCIQSSKSINFHVGLDQLYPAWVILSIGVISSITVLALEKQVKIMQERPLHSSKLVIYRKPLFPFVK